MRAPRTCHVVALSLRVMCIVAISAAPMCAATIPDLKFIRGRYQPAPPTTPTNPPVFREAEASSNTPFPPSQPPSNPLPPPPPPPNLPTTTIDANSVVELGSAEFPVHVLNKGHAAVGTFQEVGTATVHGSFSNVQGSFLYYDVSGTSSGQYDLLRTHRMFELLHGTIRVVFRRGYSPQAGDVIPLAHFGHGISLAGQGDFSGLFEFANVTSEPVFDFSFDENLFSLRFQNNTTFVPEPSAIVLAACLILIASKDARRHKANDNESLSHQS
jgi:hypothetical protein